MMKHLIVVVLFLVPVWALAQQPAGSGAPGSADPAPTGSAAPAPAPGSAADAPGAPAPAPDMPADAAAARKACADAMNADPSFEKAIVEVADRKAAEKRLQLDLEQHEKAAAAVAKNQKHVILAYAAMWIVAVAFVIFLWRRQQLLKVEIAQLKADLDAATKDPEK